MPDDQPDTPPQSTNSTEPARADESPSAESAAADPPSEATTPWVWNAATQQWTLPTATHDHEPHRRRNLLLGAAVVIVVAIIAVLLATRSGGNHESDDPTGDGGDPGTTDPYPTRAATCAIEVNVAMDVESNGGQVYQAIGTTSPVYSLAIQVLPTFESSLAQVGSNQAETDIIPTIQKACAGADNPILTSGQVDGLKQLAPEGDATSLDGVTLFATTTSGR